MPEKLEVWSCKFCGAEFTERGHAVNCENSHLHKKDLAVHVIEKPANDPFCYSPREPWPTFVRLTCTTRGIPGKVYQLVSPKIRKAFTFEDGINEDHKG